MISNELILHIGSFCSIKDIYNLSLTNKVISELKLYRLCMSHIFCHRYYGEYSSLNEFKYHLKDLKSSNTITFKVCLFFLLPTVVICVGIFVLYLLVIPLIASLILNAIWEV